MESLLSLGVGLIALICGGSLLYLFLLGPLPYIISASIKKVEGRNYWKAFGVFGISAVATFLLRYLLQLFLEGFVLSAAMFLVMIAVQILLVVLLYKANLKTALAVWIIAVLISVGIATVIVVAALVLAGTAAIEIYNLIRQQVSFLPLFV